MAQTLWVESSQKPGAKLALHWWKNALLPNKPLRGFVWIVHGLGEHGQRYAELATFLTNLGFDVLAPDLPGHGLSRTEGGAKSLVSVDEACEELVHLQGHWVRQGPLAGQGAATAPWFLVGHSLGALTSLAWILRGKRSGLEPEFARRAFISAPPLRLRMAVPAWKASMARWLGSTLPDITIANGISPDDLSYDAANVAAYRADPLVHGHASPRNYLSMLAKAAEVLDRPQDVEIPVCLAVGADDPVCDPATTRAYYGALGTHKKFFEFPHAKHEILNETSRRRCFEELAAWFL